MCFKKKALIELQFIFFIWQYVLDNFPSSIGEYYFGQMHSILDYYNTI